jgi:hypothetical protein
LNCDGTEMGASSLPCPWYEAGDAAGLSVAALLLDRSSYDTIYYISVLSGTSDIMVWSG